MQSQDNCNLIDKSWILSTFHDSWTIILWEKELPAIFELSDSIHRSCHTDGQINIWWANEPRRNKKPPVFGKRRRSRGTNVENYSKWPTPIWISVYWHFMYIYIYHMLRFVSMTPLGHCILKQLLVNHINCKDITDYTQSYHSRKATRQPTQFYNSKGKSKSEWQTKSQQLGTAFRQCILESSQLWKNCTIATAIYWDQITIHWDQISIHWDQITIHGDRQKQAF